MARRLIAGNWKMNGSRTSLSEFEKMVSLISTFPDHADCLVCPPATLISPFKQAAGGRISLGGQTCHCELNGAYTGDLSAEMLAEAGATYVIVGHSERRDEHGETDEIVAAQASAAVRARLIPIICVGESLAEREAGNALEVVARQLEGSIPGSFASDQSFAIAYEPIWAIGTGQVANPPQIEEIHTHMRRLLMKRFGTGSESIPLLYGGSMKPGNAVEILAVKDVDGGLIGGASLKADDFMAIYAAAVS
ncbi:MAG: triose-phosphate isomerase [Pseudomonadota bacterium]